MKTVKYLAIKDEIIRRINEGVYNRGDKLPSEQELATSNQVSVITSKKALDELEKDGYIYRVKGSGSFVTDGRRAESKSDLKVIAIVLPLGSNTGGGMNLVYSVEMVAKSNGYYVSVENTHSSCQKEREIILSLLNDRIKGIIYYPTFTSENFDLIKKLAMNKYPIVVIDKSIYDIEIDTVLCDNYKASHAMTKYLISCGHRNIAFVCEGFIDERSSLRERFLGYCDALNEAGIQLNLDLVMYQNAGCQRNNEIKPKGAFLKEVVEKVQTDKTITALQVASDADAAEIIHLCTRKGIRIPDDVTVVGFDDLDIASYITPSLTTAKQNFKLIGQKAAELIFSRLKTPDRKSEKIIIPAEIVVRKSSASVEKEGNKVK